MSEQAKIPVEHAGHWVDANIWFHLGLNKTEAAALKLAARRLLKAKGRTSARAAHWLLRAALAHFQELHELLARDLRYADAERLDHERYLESLAARAQGIAPLCARDRRTIHSCRIEVEAGGRWNPYAEACASLGAGPIQEAAEWMMPRKAVSMLRKVQAQLPALSCRVHNDGVDHYWDNKALREGRQP